MKLRIRSRYLRSKTAREGVQAHPKVGLVRVSDRRKGRKKEEENPALAYFSGNFSYVIGGKYALPSQLSNDGELFAGVRVLALRRIFYVGDVPANTRKSMVHLG